MVFPDKHITIAESLLGLGSFVLKSLDAPRSIDMLWSDFEDVNDSRRYPAYHTFEDLLLAVDFLFAIGAIREDKYGRLAKCD